MDMKGIEHVQDSYAKGKGLLMICGHYGPWEFYLQSFALSGIPIEIVARRIKNPYVDALVTHYRTIHGTQIILSKNAARNTLRALKEGKMVGILMDHHVREGGLTIPFLGRMANTTSLPALLALHLGVPVHFIRGWHEGEKIKMEILPAMNFAGISNSSEGIKKVTQMMNKVFEDWIREKPENWFWIHNRWKN